MFVSAAIALLDDAKTRLACADIGSAGGFIPRLQAIRSHADMIGFDADPEETERLNRRAVKGERHINAAIGLDDSRLTLELHKKRMTSSLYPTNMDYVRHFDGVERLAMEKTIPFATKSLDSVCRAEHIDRLDFIKIDVEGHELAVLQGYTAPLLVAEVETSFYPFRKGVPLFDQVMGHMLKRGFILLDLRRNFWSPTASAQLPKYDNKGTLIWADALFILDPFSTESRAILKDSQARARYLALLCLYGYAAESLAIISAWVAGGLMPDAEGTRSAELIRSHCPSRSRIPLRLARVMFFLERFFRFPFSIRGGLFSSDFAQSDREVGNWE
jgi:FkbM family methyltransferase